MNKLAANLGAIMLGGRKVKTKTVPNTISKTEQTANAAVKMPVVKGRFVKDMGTSLDTKVHMEAVLPVTKMPKMISSNALEPGTNLTKKAKYILQKNVH